MSGRRAWFVIGAIALSGCGVLLSAPGGKDEVPDAGTTPGLDGATATTDATGPDASAASDAAVTCAQACVADAPLSWDGPLAIRAACPDGWKTVDVGSTGLQTSAASCGCGCTVTSSACPSTVRVESFTDLACGSTCTGPTAMPADTCISQTGGEPVCFANSFRTYVDAPPTFTGTCRATSNVQRPAFGWLQHATGCEPPLADRATCGLHASCAPFIPSERVCITRKGEWNCDPPYVDRELLYQSAADTRDCACSCTTSGTCDASVTPGGLQCGPIAGPSPLVNGGCYAAPSTIQFASLSVSAQNASCGTTGVPNGAVTATDPVTMCCLTR